MADPRVAPRGLPPEAPFPAKAARVPSMSRPKGTADGHAASQPRHDTHSSMAVRNSSSIGRPAASTMGPGVRIDPMHFTTTTEES